MEEKMRKNITFLLIAILVLTAAFPINYVDASINEQNIPSIETEVPALTTVHTPTTSTLATTPATVQIEIGKKLTIPQKFSDISNDYWAKNAVMQLVDQGVISGYPDNEFRPAVAIKRGQAANILSKLLQLPAAPYVNKFSDVTEKSSFAKGVFSTHAAGIFSGKSDGSFGVNEALTREQLATTIVRAFKLKDTGKAVTFTDWDKINASHRTNVKILAQHGISTGRQGGFFDPKATVDRATFAVLIHRTLVKTGKIGANVYTIQPANFSANFTLNRQETNFVQVTKDNTPLYLRTNARIASIGMKTEKFGQITDTSYEYAVGQQGATVVVTVRKFSNGDEFIFTSLKNPGASAVTVELFEKQTAITNHRFYRHDRYPIKNYHKDPTKHQVATAPSGLLRLMSNNELVQDRMVGQAYRSKQLTKSYPATNGTSYMRDLQAEYEAISTAVLGTDFMSFYTLASEGNDHVDTWFMDSKQKLFTTDEAMNAWMLEYAQNYKKRNKWYTAQGPYSRMSSTTEPMPSSKQGHGRNLLLLKEDRALALYKEQGDRYFANLVQNSFVSLAKYKGTKTYWETEVTSTYLKSLYNITAPFVDTRFNEQIALFYYNAGAEFNTSSYNQPLKNYADFLVARKAAGHTINVGANAYYISDYIPINQEAKTHASMNHVLGGMNILLIAYEEFGDEKYIQTARSIHNALTMNKNKWIGSDGDIVYRINDQQQFGGKDYLHLTLEDLLNSYSLWKELDPTKLPVLEQLIAAKAAYLSANQYGYTVKIKNQLTALNMLKYLPKGPQYLDAL